MHHSSREMLLLKLMVVLVSSILSLIIALTLIIRGKSTPIHAPLPLASVEDPSGLRLPPHPDAIAWLHSYYKTGNPRKDNSWHTDYSKKLSSVIERTKTTVSSSHSASSSSRRRRNKKNLVVAPVGDSWRAEDNWLSQPDIASFDIIALYHGNNRDNFTCPQCIQTIAMKGPKWRLILTLITAVAMPDNNNNTSSTTTTTTTTTSNSYWDSFIKQHYEYVVFPDDDLIIDTAAINMLFSTMRDYDILLGQLSVCRQPGSFTWRRELVQQLHDTSSSSSSNERYLLRYTTFVEVMAPAFRMDFFTDVVRHTLSPERTWVGWGLDSIWPALLHYPKDRVAVVDAACMTHPPSIGRLGSAVKGDESSVYRPGLSPMTAKQEEMVTFAAFKYDGQTTAALGEPFMGCRVVGHVTVPWIQQSEKREHYVGGGIIGSAVGVMVLVLLFGLVAARQQRRRK